MIPYSYFFICQLIDHYTEILQNAKSFQQRVIAKQNLRMYQQKREAFLN
jgi:hypothetical protein